MPELPEVETMVRQLRPQLVGRTVTEAHVYWARTVARPSPRRFRAGLAGRRIESLWRRGKYFLFDLDDGRTLVGHLRMSGRLFLDEPADRDRARKHVRASFDLDDGRRLVFVDVRKFGRLALVRRPEEILPALGPEPLSAEVDGAWMVRALRSRRRMLKPLLLDQSFLAGLGNIYVDESLHLARLHPLRLSDRVPRAKAEALVESIRAVLREAIEAEGSSFDTFYRTPEGKPGRFQESFSVYGRQGLPCRSCGTTIRRLVVSQRGTHVCPRCQPTPRRRR